MTAGKPLTVRERCPLRSVTLAACTPCALPAGSGTDRMSTFALRDTLEKMLLSDVFLALGEPAFVQMLRSVSIGKLKTYQLYERVKLRFHLAKLNAETLRKAAPRLWARIAERDEEFATDVAQTVLVSHLDLLKAVLDFLEIQHEEGFFAKDADPAQRLTEGWQQRVYDRFRNEYLGSARRLLHQPPELGIDQVRRGLQARRRDCRLTFTMLEQQLSTLEVAASDRIGQAQSPEALEAARIDILGRKGTLADLSKQMAKLAPEQKAGAGKLLNSVKQSLESLFEARKKAFDDAALALRLDAEWLDLTLPAPGVRPGSLHPVTQVQREIEQLFTSMGFAVLDGPEVETEYNNFDALNIPADHPARDTQDTFWLTDGHLLRTHTSPVQIRGMKKFGPPLRMIAPGRVFRNEEVDASHEHTFYQLEGMMIDRNVSVANLIYFMKSMLSADFPARDQHPPSPRLLPLRRARFRARYAVPAVRRLGMLGLQAERLGGGRGLRPRAPECPPHGGIDPEQWNGFAFGLGLTRLVMMRYAIDDIRWLARRRPAFREAILEDLTNREVLLQRLAELVRRARRDPARSLPPDHPQDRRVGRRRALSARALAQVRAARIVSAEPIPNSKNRRCSRRRHRGPRKDGGLRRSELPRRTRDRLRPRRHIHRRQGNSQSRDQRSRERRHARERRRARPQPRPRRHPRTRSRARRAARLAPDHIIEIDNKSITHRPDLWGHHGMAREVAAVTGRRLLDPVKLDLLPAGDSPAKVEHRDYALCPRYSALAFENVTVQPSPLWLQYRLEAIGLNPINNIVDVTNLIMSELAQPMHAFDAVQAAGRHHLRAPREAGRDLRSAQRRGVRLDSEQSRHRRRVGRHRHRRRDRRRLERHHRDRPLASSSRAPISRPRASARHPLTSSSAPTRRCASKRRRIR